jgi:hypothetical protein
LLKKDLGGSDTAAGGVEGSASNRRLLSIQIPI